MENKENTILPATIMGNFNTLGEQAKKSVCIGELMNLNEPNTLIVGFDGKEIAKVKINEEEYERFDQLGKNLIDSIAEKLIKMTERYISMQEDITETDREATKLVIAYLCLVINKNGVN